MELKPKEKKSSKLIIGIALVFFGFVLLEDTLGFDILDQLLPLILIGFGVMLIIKRRNKEMRQSTDSHTRQFQQKTQNFEADLNKKVHKAEAVFDETINKFEEKISQFDKKIGDFDRSFKSGFTETPHQNGKVIHEKTFGDLFINLKGINVENVEASTSFGNLEIQMREAIFTNGLNRLIISNFIGDINIFVPKAIPLFVNCTNFIGDIEAIGKRSTGFGNKVESYSTNYDSSTRKLYISCSSFIGDIRIYSN